MVDQISLEEVASQLKPVPSLDSLENYLANRILYPQTLPLKESDMQIDLRVHIARPQEKMDRFSRARLRVEKDVVTRIKRLLPGQGRINVRVGQEVSPDEIIGNVTLPAGFRIINLAILLSVSPKEAGKFLTRKIGQNIYKGELLAYKKGGLLGGKKILTAPTDGIIELLNEKTGELKISFLPKKMDFPAGVYGIVEEIDQDAVVIRTEVSRVYGMFGSGRSREGILRILTKKDDLVGKNAIQAKYDQNILAGGSLFLKETISAAISMGVNGIITGGMNASDYRGMAGGTDIGISIVGCEGFGSVSIGDDIFNFLSEFEGRFVIIDGNKALINLPSSASASLIKVKNTILPKSTEETKDEDIAELKVGLRVRIIGNSYLGEQGKIKALNNSPTLLPSGIRVCLATVETARRQLQVPVANLEIIM